VFSQGFLSSRNHIKIFQINFFVEKEKRSTIGISRKSINSLKQSGKRFDNHLLKHVSPLGWEHINLTGDYIWRANNQPVHGKLRPLMVK
jgi:Tn3 transposase DDE domain